MSFTIQQDIFKDNRPVITVRRTTWDKIAGPWSEFLVALDSDKFVGLAPTYGKKSRLASLAIASASDVLIISMPSSSVDQKGRSTKHRLRPLEGFLTDATVTKYAFQMDKLSAALYYDFDICICRGKDVLSISKADRLSMEAILQTLGSLENLNSQAVKKLFRNDEGDGNDARAIALQAWAAYCSAHDPALSKRHGAVVDINTDSLEPHVLDLVCKTIRNGALLSALKPTNVKHDAKGQCSLKSGKVIATSERYKTRIMRPGEKQHVSITFMQPNGKHKVMQGRTTDVKGRTAELQVAGRPTQMPIVSIRTIGKEKQTSAESMKDAYMLLVLQGKINLETHPFMKAIWFPSRKVEEIICSDHKGSQILRLGILPSPPPSPRTSPANIYASGSRPLNKSQTQAVDKVLSQSDSDRVVLIHGPPGTGKTTVIAACVTNIVTSSRTATVWLVAQSNVAVKNMAEKLASVNFYDFKILVSKDFHFEWHEHLYRKIEANIIRSEQFDNRVEITSRLLLNSQVILCTISTMSNHKIATMSRLVPPGIIIFDEASQIEIGDYFPLLLRYQVVLKKLVFIGDHKQLAPYGTSDIKTLSSVFEMSHLLDKAVLLDTQYRMPVPLGAFISKHVYESRLKSQHSIKDPLSCRFVDVANGAEESKGYSWQNTQEVDVAISIARQLTAMQKSFRIITPYDPQRSLLESGLKQAKLPWEDKCFNIDAFQGNEDDYIIVSLVRTVKLGFLVDQRRVNVMLTRCKKGLIICAKKSFVEGPAQDCLVGKLAKAVGHSTWISGHDVQHKGARPFR